MTSWDLMAGSAGQKPELSGTPGEVESPRARRRSLRHGRRLRARQARLRLPGARGARSRRRTAVVGAARARSIPRSAASGRCARSTKGQYVNVGPWRIPYSHTAVLNYCRELNVPVQVFLNESDANYFYFEGNAAGPLSNKKIRMREVKADVTGSHQRAVREGDRSEEARPAADARTIRSASRST